MLRLEHNMGTTHDEVIGCYITVLSELFAKGQLTADRLSKHATHATHRNRGIDRMQKQIRDSFLTSGVTSAEAHYPSAGASPKLRWAHSSSKHKNHGDQATLAWPCNIQDLTFSWGVQNHVLTYKELSITNFHLKTMSCSAPHNHILSQARSNTVQNAVRSNQRRDGCT